MRSDESERNPRGKLFGMLFLMIYGTRMNGRTKYAFALVLADVVDSGCGRTRQTDWEGRESWSLCNKFTLLLRGLIAMVDTLLGTLVGSVRFPQMPESVVVVFVLVFLCS